MKKILIVTMALLLLYTAFGTEIKNTLSTFTAGANFQGTVNATQVTVNDTSVLLSSDESGLDVNSSDIWITYSAASDLNNLLQLHWNNITNKPANLDTDSSDDITNNTFGWNINTTGDNKGTLDGYEASDLLDDKNHRWTLNKTDFINSSIIIDVGNVSWYDDVGNWVTNRGPEKMHDNNVTSFAQIDTENSFNHTFNYTLSNEEYLYLNWSVEVQTASGVTNEIRAYCFNQSNDIWTQLWFNGSDELRNHTMILPNDCEVFGEDISLRFNLVALTSTVTIWDTKLEAVREMIRLNHTSLNNVFVASGDGVSELDNDEGYYNTENNLTDVLDDNYSGNTFQNIDSDGTTHSADSLTDTFTINNGTGISIEQGTDSILINHSDTSTQADEDNSGRTYIQDILLDQFGHITSLVTATETVVDTNLSGESAGGDLTGTYPNPTIAGNAVQLAELDVSDVSDDIAGDIAEGELANDIILEADLKAVDAASDEDILTYESTTGDFEWHIPSQLITAGNALTWSTSTLNFDGGASPAGELGGTWASPTLDDGALDDQYLEQDAANTLGGDLNVNSNELSNVNNITSTYIQGQNSSDVIMKEFWNGTCWVKDVTISGTTTRDAWC